MFILKKYVLAEDGEIRKNRFGYFVLKKPNSLRFRVQGGSRHPPPISPSMLMLWFMVRPSTDIAF